MKLSVTMQRALSDAETHGGYLYRQPGGFWVARPHMSYKEQPWFSLGTVRSLVLRNLMAFSTIKIARLPFLLRAPCRNIYILKTSQAARQCARRARRSPTSHDSETGMIGIGAKAGYAYGEMFTVTTYHAGAKTIYQFFKDKGMPRMMKVSQDPSDAPDGTEIRVPVRAENLYDFQQKAEQVFRYFKVQPIVHGGTLEYKRGHAVFHGKDWRYTGDRRPVATMGNVGYKIDTSALNLYSQAEQARLTLRKALLCACCANYFNQKGAGAQVPQQCLKEQCRLRNFQK